MKAAVLHAIEDLRVQNVTTPHPLEEEILIKVKVCTICGTDIRVYHYGHKQSSKRPGRMEQNPNDFYQNTLGVNSIIY